MINQKPFKILFFLLLIVGFAVSCTSSEKLLQRGEYDRAIVRSSEKLQKKPGNSKELEVLKEAYYLANTFDNERIEFLKLEGREDNWIEIYHIYEQLNRRQTIVRRLPGQIREEFDFINYNEKIVEAKSEAANISYERGLEYLARGDRHSARQAYGEFQRVRNLYPGFREVDSKLNESVYLGTNHVLFEIENNSDKILPQGFESEMRRIALADLNTGWLNFDTYENNDQSYDYYVVLNIKGISTSPEQVEVNRFRETREVEDGTKVKRDENGNIVQDSDGNNVEIPNMITVSAQVVESVQRKTAFVSGSIDFYDLRTDQLTKTETLAVESVFAHHSAVYFGDRRALSEETDAKIGLRPVSFPPDELLLLDSVDLLKEKSRSIVAANRNMLQQ